MIHSLQMTFIEKKKNSNIFIPYVIGLKNHTILRKHKFICFFFFKLNFLKMCTPWRCTMSSQHSPAHSQVLSSDGSARVPQQERNLGDYQSVDRWAGGDWKEATAVNNQGWQSDLVWVMTSQSVLRSVSTSIMSQSSWKVFNSGQLRWGTSFQNVETTKYSRV